MSFLKIPLSLNKYNTKENMEQSLIPFLLQTSPYLSPTCSTTQCQKNYLERPQSVEIISKKKKENWTGKIGRKKPRSSKIVLSCKVACYKDIQKNLFFKISQNMIGRYMNKKKMKDKKYRNLKIKEQLKKNRFIRPCQPLYPPPALKPPDQLCARSDIPGCPTRKLKIQLYCNLHLI